MDSTLRPPRAKSEEEDDDKVNDNDSLVIRDFSMLTYFQTLTIKLLLLYHSSSHDLFLSADSLFQFHIMLFALCE